MPDVKNKTVKEKLAELLECQRVVEACDTDTILGQLARAKKEFPELYSAFRLLACEKCDRIDDADQLPQKGGKPAPPPGDGKLTEVSLGLFPASKETRYYLCLRYRRWVEGTAVRQALQTGQIVEPSNVDCEKTLRS